MASSRQRDLFQAEEQSDLFGEESPTPEYRADPDSVRAELHKILAEARAAQRLPWDPTRVSLYRTIFPQMTNWLPDDEAKQLRFEFDTEMKRLKAACGDRVGPDNARMHAGRGNEISYFARTNFRRANTPFGIKQADRLSHVYMLGKTGVGKSTLIETLAARPRRRAWLRANRPAWRFGRAGVDKCASRPA